MPLSEVVLWGMAGKCVDISADLKTYCGLRADYVLALSLIGGWGVGLEGAATLDPAAFSGANVEIEFDAPADGKVRFTAGPKEKGAGAFFMKVKMAE